MPVASQDTLDVKECLKFKELLQDLMNDNRIEISHRRKEEGEVFMQSSDTNMNVPKPLVIHFTRNATTYMSQGFQPIILKAPSSFPYDNNKAVLLIAIHEFLVH